MGLENLDSYLNVKNLKLCKLQVSDSKPQWLLQIKVNLEMVFVYPRATCEILLLAAAALRKAQEDHVL